MWSGVHLLLAGVQLPERKRDPTFKYLYNLTSLPENIRHNISKCVQTEEEVYINKDIEFFKASPIGAEAVCWKLAGALGIVDALSELSKKENQKKPGCRRPESGNSEEQVFEAVV